MPPPPITPACTAYSLAPKTKPISFQYTTKRDPKSGVVRLVPAGPTPSSTAGSTPSGFDLRLRSSVNDVNVIPTEGKNLIIVATVNRVLHFRIFDGDGKEVVHTDENRLKEEKPQIGQQIEELRKRLENLWPPHQLTSDDKVGVITTVTSIVCYTPPSPTAGSTPIKLTVVYNDGTVNPPPTTKVVLVVQSTYEGKQAMFTTGPTCPDVNNPYDYGFDLTGVANSVLDMINNRLTPDFDPDARGDKFTLTEVMFWVFNPSGTEWPPKPGTMPAVPKGATLVPVNPGTVVPTITVDEVFGDPQLAPVTGQSTGGS